MINVYILLIFIAWIATCYICYVIGSYDRRIPKMDNESAMEWHTMSDEQWCEICKQVQELNERRVAKEDDQQPPF